MASLEELAGVVNQPSGDHLANLVATLEPTAAQGTDPLNSTGAAGVFGGHSLRGFLNGLLALPSGAGELAAKGLDKVGGEPAADVLRAIPSPTIEGNFAPALRSIPSLTPGGETPGAAFDRNRSDIQGEIAAGAEQHPFAAGAGDVVGDIGALLVFRNPFSKSIKRAEEVLMTGPGVTRFGTDVQIALNKTLTSPAVRTVVRGAGRSVETGFEAMVLDLMKGDDPFETAGFAAGGQLAGSLLVSGPASLLKGNVLTGGAKIAVAAGSIGAMWQLAKSLAPGGKDYILPSIEFGFDKVALALVLGLAAGAMGAGRLRGSGEFRDAMPKIADALAAIPRAGTLSVLDDLLNAPKAQQDQVISVMDQLTQNPEYFGAANGERIKRAISSGNVVGVISRLAVDNREFREQLKALEQ